jgi:hypothetical protein
MKSIVPLLILEELEKIDRSRWGIENGSSHEKIKIDGKLLGVFSRSGKHDIRSVLNVRSQIRRYVNAGRLDRAL